jgi:glycosyltransferase involved in cell wall biosynthesis
VSYAVALLERVAPTEYAVKMMACIEGRTEGGGRQPQAPRVAFLVMAYYPYRVPLFEELHRKFKDGFLVITLRTPGSKRPAEARHAGRFPRMLVRGWTLRFRFHTRKIDAGAVTPFGPAIAPALARCLWQFRPDVVISANLSTWTLTSILFGYPTIIFWEGTLYTERTVGRLRLRLRRWMARRARAFVTNGTLGRDYIERVLGVEDERIFPGGLGPELPPGNLLGAAVTFGGPGARVRFLFVGEIVSRKGVAHLLHATRLLMERGYSEKSLQVTLLGEGAERASMERLSGELGVRHLTSFAGGVRSAEVWQYYHGCDVFVLPTVHDPWPLVVPEAMSMGKPILLSKYAGSAPDLVRTGENGFIFDPEDHSEFARLMSFYVDHPEVLTAHGSRSREIAQGYTPANVAQAYIRAVDYALR